jgi:hypothetical protein
MSAPLPYAVQFRGLWACPCLAEWLPVYEAELLRLKVIKQNIDIVQLIGNAKQSGGTHSKGGCADLLQRDATAIKVAREMGAASWHRTQAQGFSEHNHLVLNGCPHNGPAAYQVAALAAGYNGLGVNGHQARDDGPEPRKLRTYKQGIAWAKERQRPLMKEPLQVPPHLNNFQHILPYHKNNSIVGLNEAVANKKPAVDLDAHVTKDGVVVCTHWPYPLKQDTFFDPKGRIKKDTPIWELTWAEVARLRTPDDYRIHRMATMIRLAAARDLRVELEAKDSPGFAKLETWKQLKVTQKRYSADVQMKTLTSLHGYPERLTAARVAGFTTILLPRDTKAHPVDRSLWPVISLVRGPIHWTGKTPKAK